MKLRILFLRLISLVTYIFLWAPVIVIIVFSFSANKYGIKWDGFTWKWYAALLENDMVRETCLRSLVIALITVVVSTFLGTITAYGLYKLKFKGKQLLRTSILLPIVMPEVVTGAALLLFFIKLSPLQLGYTTIIIAHIVFSTPLAVFVILGRMQRIDWSWEEASMDLGATRLSTFRRVIGPLLMPGIAGAAALIFPWSFDDFVITYFVSGIGNTTLPIYVFSQLRHGSTPVINVIGTLFTVITLIGLLATKMAEKRSRTARL
ncbi:MAG: ABC transporter permease [Desulfobacteraceae bacterium]|nr:ABC transporter permease [Desulfobacteraceae bacterium]MBC2749383.1 ABC transporter permease [Desulfobacteraceae bacterium]